MSVGDVKRTRLGGGISQLSGELDAKEVERCVREVLAFLQLLCQSNPVMALTVAHATLETLKRLFDVRGEIVVSEHPLQ